MRVNNNYIQYLKVFAILLSLLSSYSVLLKENYFPADYENYQKIYNSSYVSMDDIEPGFKVLSYLFYSSGLDYEIFAFVIFSICIITKVRISQKFSDSTTGLMFLILYICFFAFLHELTQLRLAIATTLFYVAIYYHFVRKRNVYSGLSICLAFLFHYSILFLALSMMIKSKKRLVVFFFAVLISLSLINNYIYILSSLTQNQKVIDYLSSVSRLAQSSERNLNLLTLNNIVFFTIYIIVSFAKRKLIFNETESKLLTAAQNLNIIGFMLFYIFNSIPVIAFRLPELLRVLYPLVLVVILKRACEQNTYSSLLKFLISICSITILFVTVRAVSMIYN